jgi:thiamine pyrophosphokinase
LGNIQILKEALDNKIKARMINSNNEIILINKRTILKKNNYYKYISLIPLTTKVEQLTLIGFKYELNKRTLQIGQSIGISNEQTAEDAVIEMKEGILIVIKSKDKNK